MVLPHVGIFKKTNSANVEAPALVIHILDLLIRLEISSLKSNNSQSILLSL